MIIFWRGYGWLVPIVIFGGFVLSQLSVDAIYGDGFYKSRDWPKYLGVGLGAVAVGLVGLYLNYLQRPIQFDAQTGESLGRGPSHSLFFIPVEYWAAINIALYMWVLE